MHRDALDVIDGDKKTPPRPGKSVHCRESEKMMVEKSDNGHNDLTPKNRHKTVDHIVIRLSRDSSLAPWTLHEVDKAARA